MPARSAAARCREKGGRAASLRVAFPDLASTVAEVGKPWPYARRAAGTLRRGGAERRSTPGSVLRAAESVGLGTGGAPPFVRGGSTAPARPARGRPRPLQRQRPAEQQRRPRGSGHAAPAAAGSAPEHRGWHPCNHGPSSPCRAPWVLPLARLSALAFLFTGILKKRDVLE